MKKIFLFAALTLSATLMAQKSINWFSAIESNATTNGTTAVGSNNLHSISAYEDGSVLVAGSFASCQLTPATATFMNQSFVGAPFTVNQSNSNNNIIVAKISKAGEVQWLIHSNRGHGSALAIATSDGGALVFATVSHTDENVQGDNKCLQFYNGTDSITCAIHDYKAKNFQYGELVKVAADGKSATVVGELLNQGTSNDFTAMNWSGEAGSYYNLLLQVKKEVKFGATTITPAAGGSLVVLQFNSYGSLVQHLVTDIPSSANSAMYYGGTTYVGAMATIDGSQSYVLKTYNEWFVNAREDTIKGVKLNNKNVLQLKKVLPAPDGKSMYLAGAVNGGLALNGNDTLKNESGQLRAVVLKVSFSTPDENRVYMHGEGISQFSDLFRYQNNLYAYGYDMSKKDGDGIYLVRLSDELQPLDTVGLFVTTGTEVTWNAVEADGNIVLAANTAKAKTLQFTADNTKNVTTSTLSRILASITLTEPKPTDLETIASADTKAIKVIRNGQVLILRDGKLFNTLGARVE